MSATFLPHKPTKEKPTACRDCAWARWELTDKGNIRRTIAGRCAVPWTMPPVPACFTVRVEKSYIWPGQGERCPAFTKRTGAPKDIDKP